MKIDATRRSRSEWIALVSKYECSGLERREFADQEGLNANTFGWWASRLLAKKSKPRTSSKRRTPRTTPGFVAVRVATPSSERSVPTFGAADESGRSFDALPLIEIVFGNGRIVRCHLDHANDERLARVLALAEGERAC